MPKGEMFVYCLAVFIVLCSLTVFANPHFKDLQYYIYEDEYINDITYSKISEDADFSKDFMFVSLGSRCMTSQLLNTYKLRAGAFPFDWLISDYNDSIILLLKNDFAFFLDLDVLFPNPQHFWHIDNFYYKLEFRHEWMYTEPFSVDILRRVVYAASEKYNRRIARFRRIKTFKGTVFFIRLPPMLDGHYYWEDQVNKVITFRQAQELRDALRDYFPDLNFNLIIVNYCSGGFEKVVQNENIFEFKVNNSYDFMFAYIKNMAGLKSIGNINNL